MEVVSVGEHDAELANLVGHVALETATLDYWACHVVAKVLGDDDAAWHRWFGQSGQQLLEGLRSAGSADPRLRELTPAMASVIDRRNQALHGLWFHDGEHGANAYEIARPLRKSVTSDDRLVTLEDLRVLRKDVATLDTYVFVVWSSLTPTVQYGSRELVPSMDLRLPSLEGIGDRRWPVSAD